MQHTRITFLAVAALLVAMVGVRAGTAANEELALGGYCPVAYSAMGKAMKGKAKFSSQYEGRTYHFANAEAKQMFAQAPERYLPAWDGLCATALAEGKKLASDPKIFQNYNGRTYLFSSAKAKAMFEKDPEAIIAKAETHWKEMRSAH